MGVFGDKMPRGREVQKGQAFQQCPYFLGRLLLKLHYEIKDPFT